MPIVYMDLWLFLCHPPHSQTSLLGAHDKVTVLVRIQKRCDRVIICRNTGTRIQMSEHACFELEHCNARVGPKRKDVILMVIVQTFDPFDVCIARWFVATELGDV